MLFKAPMVIALLDGTKTQTRRIIKPDPGPYWNPVVGLYNPIVIRNGGYEAPGPEIFGASDESQGFKCPYGRPGERLWVKETFMSLVPGPAAAVKYRADDHVRPGLGDFEGLPWKPSIFMPRDASRILLEITAVRVERLHALSESDAIAEGIERMPCIVPDTKLWRNYDPSNGWTPRLAIPQNSYRSLWESISGAGSWAANPWVWVIEFKRIEPGAA